MSRVGCHPRVLKEILQEGPFCEEQIWAEYFGGVMASSRSDVDRDDRGARFAALLARLSSYQIRCHFVLYRLFKVLFDGTGSANTAIGRNDMQMFVPIPAFRSAMDMTEKEDLNIVLMHSIVGLVGESLLDNNYQFGAPAFLKENGYPEAVEPGLLVVPSLLGVELFHWAHGLGDVQIAEFLQPSRKFESEIVVAVVPGVRGVRKKELLLDDIIRRSSPPSSVEGPG
jgi:hypothetical protein